MELLISPIDKINPNETFQLKTSLISSKLNSSSSEKLKEDSKFEHDIESKVFCVNKEKKNKYYIVLCDLYNKDKENIKIYLKHSENQNEMYISQINKNNSGSNNYIKIIKDSTYYKNIDSSAIEGRDNLLNLKFINELSILINIYSILKRGIFEMYFSSDFYFQFSLYRNYDLVEWISIQTNKRLSEKDIKYIDKKQQNNNNMNNNYYFEINSNIIDFYIRSFIVYSKLDNEIHINQYQFQVFYKYINTYYNQFYTDNLKLFMELENIFTIIKLPAILSIKFNSNKSNFQNDFNSNFNFKKHKTDLDLIKLEKELLNTNSNKQSLIINSKQNSYFNHSQNLTIKKEVLMSFMIEYFPIFNQKSINFLKNNYIFNEYLDIKRNNSSSKLEIYKLYEILDISSSNMKNSLSKLTDDVLNTYYNLLITILYILKQINQINAFKEIVSLLSLSHFIQNYKQYKVLFNNNYQSLSTINNNSNIKINNSSLSFYSNNDTLSDIFMENISLSTINSLSNLYLIEMIQVLFGLVSNYLCNQIEKYDYSSQFNFKLILNENELDSYSYVSNLIYQYYNKLNSNYSKTVKNRYLINKKGNILKNTIVQNYKNYINSIFNNDNREVLNKLPILEAYFNIGFMSKFYDVRELKEFYIYNNIHDNDLLINNSSLIYFLSKFKNIDIHFNFCIIKQVIYTNIYKSIIENKIEYPKSNWIIDLKNEQIIYSLEFIKGFKIVETIDLLKQKSTYIKFSYREFVEKYYFLIDNRKDILSQSNSLFKTQYFIGFMKNLLKIYKSLYDSSQFHPKSNNKLYFLESLKDRNEISIYFHFNLIIFLNITKKLIFTKSIVIIQSYFKMNMQKRLLKYKKNKIIKLQKAIRIFLVKKINPCDYFKSFSMLVFKYKDSNLLQYYKELFFFYNYIVNSYNTLRKELKTIKNDNVNLSMKINDNLIKVNMNSYGNSSNFYKNLTSNMLINMSNNGNIDNKNEKFNTTNELFNINNKDLIKNIKYSLLKEKEKSYVLFSKFNSLNEKYENSKSEFIVNEKNINKIILKINQNPKLKSLFKECSFIINNQEVLN